MNNKEIDGKRTKSKGTILYNYQALKNFVDAVDCRWSESLHAPAPGGGS